jgi:hypothetical protein
LLFNREENMESKVFINDNVVINKINYGKEILPRLDIISLPQIYFVIWYEMWKLEKNLWKGGE